VHPIFHEHLTGTGLALRDFVLVMREDVIHATAMDVDLLTEVFHRHCTALKVPAGAAGAPR